MSAHRPRRTVIFLAMLATLLAATWAVAGVTPASAASTGTATSTPYTTTTCEIDFLWVLPADYNTACPQHQYAITLNGSPSPGLINYPQQYTVTSTPNPFPATVNTTMPQYLQYQCSCPYNGDLVQMYTLPLPPVSSLTIKWNIQDIVVDLQTLPGVSPASVYANDTCVSGQNALGACVDLLQTSVNGAAFSYTYRGTPKTYSPQMVVNWAAHLPFSNTTPQTQPVYYQTPAASTLTYINKGCGGENVGFNTSTYQQDNPCMWTPYWVSVNWIPYSFPYTANNYYWISQQGARHTDNVWYPAFNQWVSHYSWGGNDNHSWEDGSGCVQNGGGWADESGSDPGASWHVNTGGWLWDNWSAYGCGNDVNGWCGCHDADDAYGSWYTYINQDWSIDSKYDWTSPQYQDYNDVNWRLVNAQSIQWWPYGYWQEIPYAEASEPHYDQVAKTVPDTILTDNWYIPTGLTTSGFTSGNCPDPTNLSDLRDYNGGGPLSNGNPALGLLTDCQPNFNQSQYTIYTTCVNCSQTDGLGTATLTCQGYNPTVIPPLGWPMNIWNPQNCPWTSTWSDNPNWGLYDNQTITTCVNCGAVTYQGSWYINSFIDFYWGGGWTGNHDWLGNCWNGNQTDNDGSDETGWTYFGPGDCGNQIPEWKDSSPDWIGNYGFWSSGPWYYNTNGIQDNYYWVPRDDWQPLAYQYPTYTTTPWDTLHQQNAQTPPLLTTLGPDGASMTLVIQQLQPVQNVLGTVFGGGDTARRVEG